MEDLKKDELTKAFVSKSGLFLEWSAKDRRLVAYPCSDSTIFNLCAFMPSSEATIDTQDNGEWGEALCSDSSC